MLLFAAMTALPVGLAAAQVAPAPASDPESRSSRARQSRARSGAAGRSAGGGRPRAAAASAGHPAAAACGKSATSSSLLTFIRNIGGEGLDPRDYDPDGLMNALQTGDPMVISRAATDRFNLLSSDLALGPCPRQGPPRLARRRQ